MNAELRLKDCFNKAEATTYWHHLMKLCHNTATYEGTQADETIKRIAAKTQKPVTFQEKANFGWTPAHVAVIANNKAGLVFLRTKGASLVELDDEKKTPEDYCKLLNRFDLLSLLKTSTLQLQLAPLFKKWAVPLSNEPFHYRANTADFGVVIKKLLFSGDNQEKRVVKSIEQPFAYNHFIENMREVATKVGFTLVAEANMLFCRDGLITLPDGRVVVAWFSEGHLKAKERTQSLALLQQQHGSYATANILFSEDSGVACEYFSDTYKDFITLFKQEPERLGFYLEGGNHFLSSNCEGDLKLVMSHEDLYTTLNHHLLERYFEKTKDDLLKLIDWFNQNSSEAELQEQLKEMDAQGYMPEGFDRKASYLSLDQVRRVVQFFLQQGERTDKLLPHQIATHLGYHVPFKALKTQDLMRAKPHVITYMAKKLLTRAYIAEDFDLQPENLLIIKPISYHLDIFMRPGPKGSYFLHSFQLAEELLELILKHADEHALTPNDILLLKRYIASSKRLGADLEPLFLEAKKELKRGKFTVIPAPMLFFDEMPRLDKLEDLFTVKGSHLNFMNAISGFSEKTRRYYYITNGAKAADRLGRVLMDSFECFMKSYLPNIELFFVGYDPKNPTDFSQAQVLTSRLDLKAGVHCMSKELETESHTG